MSSLDNNKALVRRFYTEAWNQQNLDILEETHAPDWVHYDPSNPADLRSGPQGNRERLTEVIAAFPDIHYTLEDLIAEGDRVVVRFTVRGTQQGAFGPIPATGRTVTMQGIIIHRIRDGKIAEDWVVRDTLGLMQQLGVIPAPGAAEAAGR
jgi:steroid delta-isomerase-like uncharacterized protein